MPRSVRDWPARLRRPRSSGERGDVISAQSRRHPQENMKVFDFDLDAEDMGRLDGLTTDAALAKFRQLYDTCVLRDTPDAGKAELLRKDVTVD